MNNLTEGEHYYYSDEGYVVLTEKYHLEKGDCCGNGCRHCPYAYKNVAEPKRGELLSLMPDGKATNQISG
jgi:hypothetical protein